MNLAVRPRIYFHRLLKEWIIPLCSNRNNSTNPNPNNHNKSPAVLFLVVLSLVMLSLMMLFPGVLFPVQGLPICRITTPIPFPE
jgi:hypothetical protein